MSPFLGNAVAMLVFYAILVVQMDGLVLNLVPVVSITRARWVRIERERLR